MKFFNLDFCVEINLLVSLHHERTKLDKHLRFHSSLYSPHVSFIDMNADLV